jgi:hypothetical protein
MPSERAEQCIADRYEVLGLLGEGGMGAVYRVRDRRSDREIALKRLFKLEGGSAVTAELFEREFHTLSELAHPRIIAVYDYGVDAEGAFYTMELLGGQDLRALGKLNWRTACGLLRDVASSLAIVHSRRLLHGDLSPRNVRCTLDGRAKLLDFGAMAPMGVAKRVVGTPPFIAPEMVQMQALDGRTDLYALGGLGYFLLTGRHAYPAAEVDQLRDRWRTPPPPPMALEPETPPALSDLVMELLQLNRNLRPRSAGLVMERLCAIASLPLAEQADVAQAYLTTPALVGRQTQLAAVRERMLGLNERKGGTILVRGQSGSGRSRFLDGCVLEAKLLGAHVIRADRGDADGLGGVAGALCRRIFELAPETAARAARLHAPILSHALGAELAGAAPGTPAPERRALQLAMRDFVLSVGRSMRLVIAVDDVDRIDEASMSLLVALAHKAPRRALCVIVSADAEAEENAALEALAGAAQAIELPALSEAQTEQLLGSIFNQAKHTFTVAQRVHDIARGNPRAIMQLATHLVEQRIARYEAGAFVLPERLLPSDLPSSVAAALAGRLSSLDSDALELARVLALTSPSELPTASYVQLTSHGDRARTYRAVDQLVRVQMLDVEGERYRLTDPTWRSAASEALTSEQRIALHARLARAFESSGSVSRRSYHLMESEQAEAAIRLLLTHYLKDPNEPRDPLEDYVPGMLELLERAAAAAEALRLPKPWQVELRMKLCGACQYLAVLPPFLRVAYPLLATLERDSGLTEYHSLDPSMEPMARLTEALTRAQQRYDATPEAERGLPPADAIRELARLCAIFAGMSSGVQDPSLLARIPSIAPFEPFSPAIGAIQQLVDALRTMWQGRDGLARAQLMKLARRIGEPDGAGLGALYATAMRLAALYVVGLIEASIGNPDANLHVVDNESTPGYRVNAYRVHMASHLMQGDTHAAASAQRRAELVMLQDGQLQRYPGTTVRVEIYAYLLSDDSAALKEVIERLAHQVKLYPSCQTILDIARCMQRTMQGDYPGALSTLEPALRQTRPLEHRDWAWAVGCHVRVLSELGRAQEAAELGLECLQVCEHEGLTLEYPARATAAALIAAGRAQEAATLTDRMIAHAKDRNISGIALGSLFELRAQAAAACGDGAGVRNWAARCAAAYHIERNPALAARCRRLMGRLAPDRARAAVAPAPAAGDAPHTSNTALSSVYSRLLECPDQDSRARCVLAILAEHAQAERAYLHAEREGRLSLVCGMPDEPPPDALDGALERYLEREIEQDRATIMQQSAGAPALDVFTSSSQTFDTGIATGNLERSTATPIAALLAHRSGLRMYPVLLETQGGGERVIAGIATLASRSESFVAPSRTLLATLAAALLENDDVDPVTRIG